MGTDDYYMTLTDLVCDDCCVTSTSSTQRTSTPTTTTSTDRRCGSYSESVSYKIRGHQEELDKIKQLIRESEIEYTKSFWGVKQNIGKKRKSKRIMWKNYKINSKR